MKICIRIQERSSCQQRSLNNVVVIFGQFRILGPTISVAAPCGSVGCCGPRPHQLFCPGPLFVGQRLSLNQVYIITIRLTHPLAYALCILSIFHYYFHYYSVKEYQMFVDWGFCDQSISDSFKDYEAVSKRK